MLEQQVPKQPEINRKIGKVCLDIITAAKERRRNFLKTGKEIMRYGFSREWNFEYQAMSQRAWFKAQVPKTAQAFQVIVPSLVGPVPNRLLTAKDPSNPALVARTKARSDYLNYTPQFTNFIDHMRRCHEECVGYGGGILWTGVDPRTKLVTSTFGSVRELLLDPNCDIPDDCQVSFRERVRPKFEVAAEYPDVAAQIMDLPSAGRRWSDEDANYEWDQTDNRTDCIRYYECWFRTGIQNFKGGYEIVKELNPGKSDTDAKTAGLSMDNTPAKYCVSEHGFLISFEEWPIEFHLLPSQPWPWTMVKFYNQPNSAYPVSMLQPGLSYQRAMNHLITLMMGKARRCMKTVFAIKKQGRNALSTSQKTKVNPISGADEEFIEVEMSENNQTLKSFIEQFDWSMEWLNAGITLFNLYDAQFQQATGLFEYLSTGMSQTQSRTAEDAANRERNSRTRLEDQRDMVSRFHTEVARKESFAAARILTGQDAAIVVPGAEQAWGIFGQDPQMKDPNYWMQQMQTQAMATDPMVLMQEAQAQADQVYTMDEIIYSTDFSIEAGSTRRKDIDTQLQMMKDTKNTVMPLQLQSPDFDEKALAYDTLAIDAKLQGLDPSLVQKYEQMAGKFRGMAQQQMAQMSAPPGPPGQPPQGPPQ